MRGLEQDIVDLTKEWYKLIGLEGIYKDSDCHFCITVKFSYGQNPTFSIHHTGYIAGDYGGSFATYDEALLGLETLLKTLIEEFKDNAESQQED